jgi:hypothetical protein
MSSLNKLMGRGVIPPVIHGVLDYPLAAVLIVLPLALDFDNGAAKWIAVAFGVGAAALAVGTAWPYLVVGAGGLAATLATRFEPKMSAAGEMALRMAA